MSAKRPIVIVGFMGAGKTTIGRELARRMERVFVDLDHLIVKNDGRSIADVIGSDGEARFREVESAALTEVLKTGEASVIALGGGTWCFAANRTAIAASEAVNVWLDTPFELCWQRICNSAEERPLARNEATTRAMFDMRRSDYERADIRVACDKKQSVEEILAAILGQISSGVV